MRGDAMTGPSVAPPGRGAGPLLADRLDLGRRRHFVGRGPELELFRRALLAERPPFAVLHLYGPGGVGKTALLGEYARLAAGAGVPAYRLDGRDVEPAPPAFLPALAAAMGLDGGASPLAALARRPRGVLLLDTSEALAPLDTWLREAFLPRLPQQTLVVIAGRAVPPPAWRTAPGWEGLVRWVPLRNLRPEESRAYLRARGLPAARHDEALAFTHGHPLALALVADVQSQEGAAVPFRPQDRPDVVRTLLERFVQQVPGPRHRAGPRGLRPRPGDHGGPPGGGARGGRGGRRRRAVRLAAGPLVRRAGAGGALPPRPGPGGAGGRPALARPGGVPGAAPPRAGRRRAPAAGDGRAGPAAGRGRPDVPAPGQPPDAAPAPGGLGHAGRRLRRPGDGAGPAPHPGPRPAPRGGRGRPHRRLLVAPSAAGLRRLPRRREPVARLLRHRLPARRDRRGRRRRPGGGAGPRLRPARRRGAPGRGAAAPPLLGGPRRPSDGRSGAQPDGDHLLPPLDHHPPPGVELRPLRRTGAVAGHLHLPALPAGPGGRVRRAAGGPTGSSPTTGAPSRPPPGWRRWGSGSWPPT